MWDADQMEALRIAYNKSHTGRSPILKGPPEQVWRHLRSAMRAQCDDENEACMVHALMKKATAPMSWSSKPSEWLSSTDIETVQTNYTKLVPDYHFAGCVPIDFNTKTETGKCLVSTLCRMDVREVVKGGKTMIGIVLNTDPHDQPGEHWIAAFCDLRPELDTPYMAFFDSYAYKPEPQVIELMNAWKTQWDSTRSHSNPMELVYNKVRHQFKNSECGVYCIYFLHCSIFGIPMESRIPDDVMTMMRQFFFTMPKKRRNSS
jgi:hypothetical protein